MDESSVKVCGFCPDPLPGNRLYFVGQVPWCRSCPEGRKANYAQYDDEQLQALRERAEAADIVIMARNAARGSAAKGIYLTVDQLHELERRLRFRQQREDALIRGEQAARDAAAGRRGIPVTH